MENTNNNIKNNKHYYRLSLLHRYTYKFNFNTLVMIYLYFVNSNIKYCFVIRISTFPRNIHSHFFK